MTDFESILDDMGQVQNLRLEELQADLDAHSLALAERDDSIAEIDLPEEPLPAAIQNEVKHNSRRRTVLEWTLGGLAAGTLGMVVGAVSVRTYQARHA